MLSWALTQLLKLTGCNPGALQNSSVPNRRMRTRPPHATENYQAGRDELTLADFPISVLQRQQPLDGAGAKRDTAVYEASRYDRDARQRVQQRVILETSARHGLPT